MTAPANEDAAYRHFYSQYSNQFNNLFRWLDRGFVGMDKDDLDDQVFQYNGTVNVTSRFEVPVVVPLPGDVIDYQLAIKEEGEVSIGIFQIVENDEEEGEAPKGDNSQIKELFEVGLYSRDKTLCGSLELQEEGTVFFVIDNDQTDWLGNVINKTLSYTIRVYSHSFTFIDEERNVLSRKILNDMLADRSATELKLDDADEAIEHLEDEIDDLQDELSMAKAEIQALREDYHAQLNIAKETSPVLSDLYYKFAGLFYRGLDSRTLAKVLSFLPPSSTALVCKAWQQIVAPPRAATSSATTSPSKSRRRLRQGSARPTRPPPAAAAPSQPDSQIDSPLAQLDVQISRLTEEKRRIKALLEKWEQQFRTKHSRLPSEVEVRAFTKDLVERFAELSVDLNRLQAEKERIAI